MYMQVFELMRVYGLRAFITFIVLVVMNWLLTSLLVTILIIQVGIFVGLYHIYCRCNYNCNW
ncbi:MAG: hypothetical protein ACLFPL_03475 [Candidatus Nanoarchaeia archaeon]